jgi:autotransporter-associated beta strand protein
MNALFAPVATVRRLLLIVAAVAVLAAPASAATFTWSGGGVNNNWTTGSNWVGGTAPTPGTPNDFVFSGSNSGKFSPNVTGTTYQVSSLTFGAGATGSYTITGALNSSLVVGSITNSSGYLQTIGGVNSLPSLQFSNAGTIDTGTSGILIRSRLAGSANISKTGSGQLEIANASANTYSGNFTVATGSLLLGANLGSSTVDVSSGAVLNTAAAGAQVNNLILSGTLLPGTVADYGSLTVNGNATFNLGSTTLLAVGSEFFDSVNVSGTTTLGGTLSIAMEYEPTNFIGDLSGDQWQLFGLDTANILGDFDSVVMTGTYGNVNFYKVSADRWESQYLGNGREFAFFTSGPNAGVLYAVPEPSTMVFAGIGAAMFGWNSWTRRRAQLRRRLIEASIA